MHFHIVRSHDLILNASTAMVSDMVDALGTLLMGGGVDVGVLGAAQVDRFGNLNTLCLGDYRAPDRRLGGTPLRCLRHPAAVVPDRRGVAQVHGRRRILQQIVPLAEPDHREDLATESFVPVLMAITTGVFWLGGGIFNPWYAVWGAVICTVALYIWFWTARNS